MSKTPTQSSPLARALGIKELGFYNPRLHSYEMTFTPNPEQTNFLGTTHGGLIAFLFDEAAGMLAYFEHGINMAVSLDQLVRFVHPVLPNNKIKVVVKVQETRGNELIMTGELKAGSKVMANMWCKWHLRRQG